MNRRVLARAMCTPVHPCPHGHVCLFRKVRSVLRALSEMHSSDCQINGANTTQDGVVF